MMNIKHLLSGLAVSASLVAASAFAGPVTIDAKYSGATFGSYQSVNFTLDGSNRSTSAGMFSFQTVNPQGDSPIAWTNQLDAFCIQLGQNLNTSAFVTYELVSAQDYFGNSTRVDLIGSLYTGFGSSVTTKPSSTAFQMALWELTHESDVNVNLGDVTLNSGRYSVNNNPGGATTLAEGWLSQLDSITNLFDIHVLTNGNSQDLLVFSPTQPTLVSEPATLGLLGLGLLGLGLRSRRRS